LKIASWRSRLAQAPNTDRIDVAGGQLDGEGDAVQASAQLGDKGGVLVAQHIPAEAGGGAVDEQLHRRRRHGDRRAQRSLDGQRQRRQTLHPFAARAQKFATGGEDIHLRRGAQERLGQGGGGLHHMFARVQHQQHSAPAQKFGQFGGAGIRAHRAAERRGDGAGCHLRLGYGRQINEDHPVTIGRGQRGRDDHRDGRLADPAGPDQRDQPPPRRLRDEVVDQGLATDDATERQGEPHDRRRTNRRRAVRRLLGGLDGGLRPQRRGEAVAAPSHGDDDPRGAVTERLAQHGHVHPQIGVVDKGVRPHRGDKLGLADDFTRPRGQGQQDIERPAAELDRPLRLQQQALPGKQLEVAEPESGFLQGLRLNRLIRRPCR
jgi:hypothetical protein